MTAAHRWWWRRRRRREPPTELVIASVASGIAAEAMAIKAAGLLWRHAFFAEIAKFPSAVLKHHYPEVPNLGDMTRITDEQIDACTRSTSSLAEPRVSPSRIQAIEEEWMTRVVNWPSDSSSLLSALAPAGSSGRTSQVRTRPIEERPSAASRLRWSSAGTASPGGYSMQSISESPNDAVASSLSAILEIGDLPQRYFLTPRACKGILNRAEKRGRKLPQGLKRALEEVANRSSDPSEPPEAEDEAAE